MGIPDVFSLHTCSLVCLHQYRANAVFSAREREGFARTDNYLRYLTFLAKRGAKLLDPESVKTTIAQLKKKDGEPYKNGTKMLMTQAYKVFAEMKSITWRMPRYHQEEITPFIPLESELDQLIASCKSQRMAAFLQCLKETYADPSEALKIEWTDIDFEHRLIAINHPVKGHLPGRQPVTTRLLQMLNSLPRAESWVFPVKFRTMAGLYMRTRQRTASRLQNPRLQKISFVSFRHWGGTMIAYRSNGNMLTVKKMLRHKAIASSMKYVGQIDFDDTEFETATATTVDEGEKLAQAGYNRFDEFNGVHIYRKPKRFCPGRGSS